MNPEFLDYLGFLAFRLHQRMNFLGEPTREEYNLLIKELREFYEAEGKYLFNHVCEGMLQQEGVIEALENYKETLSIVKELLP